MTKPDATAFAPASVANLGSGYDVIGVALDGRGDTVEIYRADEPGVRIRSITGDDGQLPREAAKNCASVAASALLDALEHEIGLELVLHKGLPLGSGLGSSAASAAAAVVALAELLAEDGVDVTDAQLVDAARAGERLATGTGHADNVAPSLLGGVVFVRSLYPIDVVSLPWPSDVPVPWLAVVSPDFRLDTAAGRRALPQRIHLKKAVNQWANVGGLVAGFLTGDVELIARSTEDRVVEPARGALIPGFYAVQSAAREAGALACSISGSGPSVFALTRDEGTARAAAAAMRRAFAAHALATVETIGPITAPGARPAAGEPRPWPDYAAPDA